MDTLWIIITVIVTLLVLLVLWYFATYNRLVAFRNRVKDSWAQIDVQLKRRADLIPNLVETVKGYAKHEASTFEEVVKARNTFVNANTVEDEMKSSNELSHMVSKLLMLQEAYPELKSNTNFMSLQNDLKECEDKISVMRQFYNDTVMKYNNKVEMVPSCIVARMAHFKKETFFEAGEKEREVPQVKFGE